VLIRADIAPQIVETMSSISGNVFNNGLAIRSDLAGAYDLAFGQNYVNGTLFDQLRVGGTSDDQLNASRTDGRNWISGGLGNDLLYSSPGKLDAFVFYTPLNSQSNTDSILGFETGGPEADQIWLDAEIFRGLLSNGDRLDTRSFTTNTNSEANGNVGQIIYNTSTGELFYDGDGAGGNQEAARFAILSGKESIALEDLRLFNLASSSPLVTPAVISLAVSAASVKEDSNGNLVFSFTRTGPTTEPLSVNYAIGGSADASDYSGATPGSGNTITFTRGSQQPRSPSPPKGDSSVEADESVSLTLAAGSGYSIGTTTAVTGTISNDDFPSITLAVAPSSVTEDGITNLEYTFTRTGATTIALTVNYSVGGTANFGTDYSQSGAASYTATTGTVIFAAGSSTAVVTVDPTADTEIESDETIALALAAGSGYSIVTSTAVTGTISNDDFPNEAPTALNISATSFNENIAAGSTVATLVTTDPDAGNTFTYSLVSGSGDTDNNAFSIAGNQLSINASPDFEAKSSYSIRVRSTDQGGLSLERSLSFLVIDLPEDPYTPGPATNGLNLVFTAVGYALRSGSGASLQVTFKGQNASESNPGQGWRAIAAAALSGGGYELFWKNSGSGQFASWVLNGSGSLVAGALLSAAELYAAETRLSADLDGDGKNGLVFSSTKTIGSVAFGSAQLGYAIKDGSNAAIPITFSGQNASASNPGGGWTAFAAAAAPGGYSLYWRNSLSGQFARWDLNASGALSSGSVLTTSQLISDELSLDIDLDANGFIGLPITAGPTPAGLSFDWANAANLAGIPGILKTSLALSSPRSAEPPLIVTALRVDLQAPGISLTGSGVRRSGATTAARPSARPAASSSPPAAPPGCRSWPRSMPRPLISTTRSNSRRCPPICAALW